VTAWADGLVERLARVYPYQHCAVFMPDAADPELLLVVAQRWGLLRDLGIVRTGEWTVPVEGSICGRVFRTGSPALITDVTLDPDYRSWPGSTTRSEVAVPIVRQEGVMAVINIESPQPAYFGIADLEALVAEASDAALAFRDAAA
jgi:GAF domain-containing protein